jgi:type II secretory pathway pseudopilin PulG
MSNQSESRAGKRAATRCAGRRDGGFSFVEIVVTIVLLGIVVVPILAAVRATVHASSVSGDAAKAETAIVNAADRVNRAPMACDYLLYVQASVQTEGWTASQAAVTVEHYDPATGQPAPGGCLPGFFAPSDGLVQLITISVTSPTQRVTRSIQVVKTDAV